MSKQVINQAKALAELFYPLAQVAVFSGKKELACFNRLLNDVEPLTEPNAVVNLQLPKQRSAKVLILPLDDKHQLQIIVDTTLFANMQQMLALMLPSDAPAAASQWQVLVEESIQQYCAQHHIAKHALTSQHKRELIRDCHEQGLFGYQDASKYIAATLDISRATVYNYLNLASQLKSIRFHQVDAFTNQPFSGNPAGVVLDADHLDEKIMKKIAREMNLSETAFVSASDKADLKCRYFTPSGHEVKFCGHSTVGTLYMLAYEKRLGIDEADSYAFTIETAVGFIPVTIQVIDNETFSLQFQTPTSSLRKTKLSYSEVAEALGIDEDCIDKHFPLYYEVNNQDLYLKIKSLDELAELQVSEKSAKLFAEKHDIIAYCLFTDSALDDKNDFHMRCYAPAVGVLEDAFTGSVLGGLVDAIMEEKLVSKSTRQINIEQGHFIDRPGSVMIKLPQRGKPTTVLAKARHFFSTDISL